MARKKTETDAGDDIISGLGAIADLTAMPDVIRRVDDAVNTLYGAGLKRRTLVLLLHDMTKVPKKQINLLLDALPKLAEHYLDG